MGHVLWLRETKMTTIQINKGPTQQTNTQNAQTHTNAHAKTQTQNTKQANTKQRKQRTSDNDNDDDDYEDDDAADDDNDDKTMTTKTTTLKQATKTKQPRRGVEISAKVARDLLHSGHAWPRCKGRTTSKQTNRQTDMQVS